MAKYGVYGVRRTFADGFQPREDRKRDKKSARQRVRETRRALALSLSRKYREAA